MNNGTSGVFEVFQYPAHAGMAELPAWEGWGRRGEPASTAHGQPAHDDGRPAIEAAMRAEFELRLGEDTRKSFEAGRERGRQAERESQAAALDTATQLRMRQAAELVENFARQRERFLLAVEQEVVELALAVAARILRREAQMDPLLLSGAVRVALAQLSRTTHVKLRVPPDELELWTKAMALVPNLARKPTVLPGEGMQLGDCQVETEMGTVDLGIRSQLGEIERGFFDRAGGRRIGRSRSTIEPRAAAGVKAHTESLAGVGAA